MKAHLCNSLISLVFALSAQSAIAGSMTMDFDNLADGVTLSNQYPGVLISDAVVASASYLPWPAHSGTNVAYAPTGTMTFAFDSAVLGSVQSVSAAISGVSELGMYAYDANGALIGQAVTSGPGVNMIVIVSTTGAPIASIAIHDGGSDFSVDTVTVTSISGGGNPDPEPIPEYVAYIDGLKAAIDALPVADFRGPASNVPAVKSSLKTEVTYLMMLLDDEAPVRHLDRQLDKIEDALKDALKNNKNMKDVKYYIDLLKKMIKKMEKEDKKSHKKCR